MRKLQVFMIPVILEITSCFILSGCGTNRPLADLPKQYASATTSAEKLHLCLTMIDLGLVRIGIRAERLLELFGNDATPLETPKVVLVEFRRKVAATSADVQTVLSSWYMVCEVDKEGRVKNYFLTNIGKGGIPTPNERKQ